MLHNLVLPCYFARRDYGNADSRVLNSACSSSFHLVFVWRERTK